MSAGAIVWTNVVVRLGDLRPWRRNPRRIGKAEAQRLAESWQEFGQVETIAVGPGLEVYNGHQRLDVLLRLYGEGYEVAARQSSRALTEKERERLTVYLHAGATGYWEVAELATWDGEELQAWGMDEETLAEVGRERGKGAAEDPGPQMDKAEELRERWGVVSGQMWLLDSGKGHPHRLICGDCTDKAVVARVMGGEKAALCFTSPPYAEQRKEQYGGIPDAQYWEWFDRVQSGVKVALAEAGHFVLNIKPHAKDSQRSLYVFDLVCAMVRQRSWLFVDEFCWLRTGIPQQVVNRFKNAFEPCYWFTLSSDYEWYPQAVMHKSDSVPLALGVGAGDTNAARRQGKGGGAIQGNKIVSGNAYPSNVLDFKQNAEAVGHPAAFPVQLPSFFVACMTIDNGIVYDPFLGSGTTLIAAEKLGRRARCIEIDAGYVAVCLERFYQMTGVEPVLLAGVGGVAGESGVGE